MPCYTEDDLRKARQPFRDAGDRDHALCVLGHLEAEEREQPNAQRTADIRAIAAAVHGFDSRTRIAAGTPAPGPAQESPPAAPGSVAASPPVSVAQPAHRPAPATATGRIDLLPRGPIACASRLRMNVLASSDTAASTAKPVDLVADMKRRHGVKA